MAIRENGVGSGARARRAPTSCRQDGTYGSPAAKPPPARRCGPGERWGTQSRGQGPRPFGGAEPRRLRVHGRPLCRRRLSWLAGILRRGRPRPRRGGPGHRGRRARPRQGRPAAADAARTGAAGRAPRPLHQQDGPGPRRLRRAAGRPGAVSSAPLVARQIPDVERRQGLGLHRPRPGTLPSSTSPARASEQVDIPADLRQEEARRPLPHAGADRRLRRRADGTAAVRRGPRAATRCSPTWCAR